MHVSKAFTATADEQVIRSIRRICFGTLITHTANGFDATPIPWVVSDTGNGMELLGHLAKVNPQVKELEASANVLLTFTGVNGYISPRILPTPFSAPTWNYEAIHVYGKADLLNEIETENAVEKLIEAVERRRPSPWSSLEMGERRERLIKYVIGVRITALRVESKYKLGQNESDVDFSAILAHLDATGERALADAMRVANAGRS